MSNQEDMTMGQRILSRLIGDEKKQGPPEDYVQNPAYEVSEESIERIVAAGSNYLSLSVDGYLLSKLSEVRRYQWLAQIRTEEGERPQIGNIYALQMVHRICDEALTYPSLPSNYRILFNVARMFGPVPAEKAKLYLADAIAVKEKLREEGEEVTRVSSVLHRYSRAIKDMTNNPSVDQFFGFLTERKAYDDDYPFNMARNRSGAWEKVPFDLPKLDDAEALKSHSRAEMESRACEIKRARAEDVEMQARAYKIKRARDEKAKMKAHGAMSQRYRGEVQQVPGGRAYQAPGGTAQQSHGVMAQQVPGGRAYQAPMGTAQQYRGVMVQQAPGGSAYQAPIIGRAHQTPVGRVYQAPVIGRAHQGPFGAAQQSRGIITQVPRGVLNQQSRGSSVSQLPRNSSAHQAHGSMRRRSYGGIPQRSGFGQARMPDIHEEESHDGQGKLSNVGKARTT